MEKAKAAVKEFTSRAGHHDTTVHEHVAPAVKQETITPTRHEEAQTVVDREVHQDHHHTTVQPVKDREVLPEQHTHNLVGTQHKEYNHDDESRVKERLAAEAAQFRDQTTTAATRETASTAATVGGEHVHHHVHETIQPVIQKETIQPSVVHTTIPVHEVHKNETKHHATSALPAVSMADFKQQGGVLGGREDRIDRFEGEPVNETGTQHSHHGGTHKHGFESGTTGTSGTGVSGAGPHNSSMMNKADPRVDSDLDGSRGMTGSHGTTGTTGTGYGSSTTGAGPHSSSMGNKVDPRVDSDRDGSRGLTGSGYGSGTTSTGVGATGSGVGHRSNEAAANTGKKPSLMDKLNPNVDANGDGKPGFMK
jgi:hypothetical protein